MQPDPCTVHETNELACVACAVNRKIFYSDQLIDQLRRRNAIFGKTEYVSPYPGAMDAKTNQLAPVVMTLGEWKAMLTVLNAAHQQYHWQFHQNGDMENLDSAKIITDINNAIIAQLQKQGY